MQPLVSKSDITTFVPQRDPILMIDELIVCEGNMATTSFLVESDNMFIIDKKLSASGLLENIAQTAAAKAGYEYAKHNQEAKVGFIGGISKVVIHNEPEIGDRILTTVEVKNEIFGVTLVACKSIVGDKELAVCEMKIVLQD